LDDAKTLLLLKSNHGFKLWKNIKIPLIKKTPEDQQTKQEFCIQLH